MNWKPIRQWTTAAVISAVIAASAGISAVPAARAAAVPKLDQIRVALILESGKLKSNALAATLSSPKGLAVTLQTGANAIPWPADMPLAGTIRTTMDQFQVKLLETADFTKAKTLKDQINAASTTVSITVFTRSGKPVYQVAAGGYASKAAASSALAAFKLQPGISVMAPEPALQGPLRWNAGAYKTQAEAEKARAAFTDKGLEAVVVLTANAGVLSYEVWLGSETDNEALQAYKLKTLKIQPTLALTQSDTSKPYVLKKEDATSSTNGAASASLLLFPLQGIKLAVAPNEGEFKVAEKSNRTYRGYAEVSYHNGKLAVINQLPFEQYLYSVVSGEMGAGWPKEALKAQAVAARTYALDSGTKYEIAQVSDSTLDQVYDGEEDADSIAAVDATAGEVLMDKNGLITAFFSSNSGGMTSNGSDVWGNTVSYLNVSPSPDEGAAKGKELWLRGVLPDGKIAYIRSDYLKTSGTVSSTGLPVYEITENGVNARNAPYVDNANNPAVAKLNKGERVTVFEQVQESNAYSWVRGPFTGAELLASMNATLSQPLSGPLSSLEVTARGDSGRVTELTANGQTVKASSPDAYRSVLGGLPSTRFEIERSGGYTIQGANGTSVASSNNMYALGASGQVQPVNGSSYFVMNGDAKVSYATSETQFTIKGNGYGHGLGMSQWGARGWAELGYDYKKILSYYYEGVTLTKE
jgi:stage II sporulation protein D